MRIAIIPARGGSKRIPGKNIVPFCGKPMVAYALHAAATSGMFDKIHVSTDSPEISRIVGELGFPTDFLRPAELADDFTGLVPVLRWVINQYASMGQEYHEVCCITPSAPLLESSDLVEALRVFEHNQGCSPLLVFAKYPVPIEWAFRRGPSGTMLPVSPPSLNKRSQDIEEAYYECGPFTIWRSGHLELEQPFANGVLSYIMPQDRAVDIDNPEDLVRAETLFRLRHPTGG